MSDVATEISRAEVVRFTVARIMSKGAPECSTSSISKRLATAVRNRSGKIRSMPALMPRAARTIVREKADEPYCVEPSSPCAVSESSVSVTWSAFFEVHSVRIITAPAASRMRKLAGTFSLSASMSIVVLPASRAMP